MIVILLLMIHQIESGRSMAALKGTIQSKENKRTQQKRPLMLLGLFIGVVVLTSVAHLSAQPVSSWFDTYGKSPAEFDSTEWRSIIDAAWAPSMTTIEQLDLFDRWWRNVDRLFGAFHDLDFDIEVFRDRYRPEIAGGVSRGRFAAIMMHFAYRLQDLHTYVWDGGVRGTRRQKGIPLLVVGQFGNNQGFGAVLTPIEDSTLVVYRVLPNHPLGLEVGDVILGYDGHLWKDIYPKLIEAELPLFVNPVSASTDEANHFYLMEAAGLNWHLFDTLDVVKYASGDTLHFDTNLLANERRTIWGSNHVDVPGVEWPNRSFGDRVGSGVVDGTEVGYVYVTSWSFDAQFDIRNKFRLAVIDLWYTNRVKAIIFDFRFNTGGGALARDVWNLMFDEVTPTIGFDERADPTDHLALREDPLRRETNLVIRPDTQTYWDRPIAVLIGPGAISAGELEARRASFHPRTRIFGLPAAGGNTGSIFPTWPRPEWWGSLATSGQFLSDGHVNIVRTALQPDESVWHTQEAVANGKDAVVEAALNWINREIVTDIEADGPAALSSTEISVYPNPTSGISTVSFTLENSGPASLKIYDVLGREVADLSTGHRRAGSHNAVWDARMKSGQAAPNGSYYVRLEANGVASTKPLIVSR